MFKILIVDDSMPKTNDLIRSITQMGLENIQIDYELEFKKACKLLSREYYDLLILDIQLPSLEYENGIRKDGGVQILEMISEVDTMKKPMSIIGLTAFDESYVEIEEKFNKKLFHLIKYDRSSVEWKNRICEKVDYLIKAKNDALISLNSERERHVDCAIITAVSVEFEEVKKCNLNWKEISIENDPTCYYMADIEDSDHSITVILAQQEQMGLVAAAELTTKLIVNFNPRLVAMVGIAAGCEGEVELGDILIASESWDYGSGKIIQNEKNEYTMLFDPHQVRINSTIKQFFNKEFRDKLYEIRNRWNDCYGDKKSKDISIRIGPVVSGAAVIQNGNLVKEYILPQSRKVIGLDMETYAVYHASEVTKMNAPFFVSMKAVSDYANKDKNDGFQKYGAFVTANFLFAVLTDLLDQFQ